MALLYLLLGSSLVLQQLVVGSALITTERDFQKINDYLLENVDQNDDPEANLSAVSKWIDSNPADLPESVMIALKQLKLLQQIQGTQFCDAQALEIKTAIRDAIKGEPGARRVQLNRIDSIVRHYFKQHAIDCSPIYPVLFADRSSQLDSKTKELVDDLYAKVVQMYFDDELKELETSKGLVDHFITNYHEFEARVVYNTIMDVFNGNIIKSQIASKDDGKIELHEDKLRKLYQNIVVDPCQRYTALLGGDIFDLIAFDQSFNDKVVEDEVDFYKGWAKYQVCNLVVSKEEKWASELVSVSKRIVANMK